MKDLLLDAVAVYRLTRLVTEDDVTAPLRGRIVLAAYVAEGRGEEARRILADAGADPDDVEAWPDLVTAHLDDSRVPKLAILFTCRWCTGMWLALGVAYVARRSRYWPAMRDALAYSAAAALIAGLED